MSITERARLADEARGLIEHYQASLAVLGRIPGPWPDRIAYIVRRGAADRLVEGCRQLTYDADETRAVNGARNAAGRCAEAFDRIITDGQLLHEQKREARAYWEAMARIRAAVQTALSEAQTCLDCLLTLIPTEHEVTA